MKHLLTTLLSLLVIISANGQKEYRKNPAIGIHFSLHDFKTAAAIRSTSLSSVLSKHQWEKVKNMNPGIYLSYHDGITDNIDFIGRLGGSFLNYNVQTGATSSNTNFLAEADANLAVKLVSDKYWVSPYVNVGAGISANKGYYDAYIPLGLGLQVNFFDEAYLFINTQYRVPITEPSNYNFMHSIGVAGNIFKRKVPEPVVLAPPPPPPASDRDGDGIIDSEDACPDVKGLAAFHGCPDTDGDGIQDSEDECPAVKGLARYKGCPIPDKDKDGINDEEDKCPDVPGVARYNGCPIPDRDNDGVNDETDKCPDVPGVKELLGCPKIDFRPEHVTFELNSAKLTAEGKKELGNVAEFLKEHTGFDVNIEGHTDNTGEADYNQKLSEKRANTVKEYLVSIGADASRLNTIGKGETSPVDDNKTKAGRAKNRRVEIRIKE